MAKYHALQRLTRPNEPKSNLKIVPLIRDFCDKSLLDFDMEKVDQILLIIGFDMSESLSLNYKTISKSIMDIIQIAHECVTGFIDVLHNDGVSELYYVCYSKNEKHLKTYWDKVIKQHDNPEAKDTMLYDVLSEKNKRVIGWLDTQSSSFIIKNGEIYDAILKCLGIKSKGSF